MNNILLNISELVGAFTVIIGALMAFEKWSKGRLTSWLLKPVLDEVKELKDKMLKMEIDNLKLIIMSEEIPIEERLQAGERYISLGGNSVIKIHYNELKRQYEKMIHTK